MVLSVACKGFYNANNIFLWHAVFDLGLMVAYYVIGRVIYLDYPMKNVLSVVTLIKRNVTLLKGSWVTLGQHDRILSVGEHRAHTVARYGQRDVDILLDQADYKR